MNCLAAATFSIVKLDPNTSSSCSSRSSITVYVSSISLSREYQFSLSRDSLWSSFLLQRRGVDDEREPQKTSFVLASIYSSTAIRMPRVPVVLFTLTHLDVAGIDWPAVASPRNFEAGDRSWLISLSIIFTIAATGWVVEARACKWECDALHVVVRESVVVIFNDALSHFFTWKAQRRPRKLAVIGAWCALSFHRMWICSMSRSVM